MNSMQMDNLNIIIDGLSKGGAETLLLSMLPVFRNKFSKIKIYHLSSEIPYSNDFQRYAGVERLPIWKLPFFLVRLRGQLVYAHLVKSIFVVNIIAFIFRNRGNQFVCHEHTSPHFYAQQRSVLFRMVGFAYQFLLHVNLKSALVFYIVSTHGAQKDCLDAGISADRLIRFPNSFPGDEINLLQASRDHFISGLNENKLNCFTISRIEPIKQIHWAMHALAQFAKGHPNVHVVLYVCGEGSDVDRLTEVANSLCNDNSNLDIRFEGFVPSIVEFLSICDLYLLPSAIEGFPLSLTAAAISGITCIVTPFGAAINDLKEKFPNIVASDSMSLRSFTKDVTAAIEKLSVVGKESSYSLHRWNSIEENTENLLEKIDYLLQTASTNKR